MHTEERRTHKRLPVPHDRAQAMVVIGRREYRAVIADVSTTGFGLLMIRGVPAELGSKLRIVTEEGISECEIVHTRKEENYLHVGTRRLSEVPFTELPKFRKATQFFRQSIAGASPLIFLGVVFGFSFVMIGMIIVVDVATAPDENKAGVVDQALAADDKPAEEPVTELEKVPTPREIVATEVKDFLDSADKALDDLQSRHVKMLATVLEGSGREWDEVAKELQLTPRQEEEIRQALEAAPEDQSQLVTRSQLMSLLSSDQRSRLSGILATVPSP
jgi:hypothetical protein